jgi:hypothetical protein
VLEAPRERVRIHLHPTVVEGLLQRAGVGQRQLQLDIEQLPHTKIDAVAETGVLDQALRALRIPGKRDDPVELT